MSLDDGDDACLARGGRLRRAAGLSRGRPIRIFVDGADLEAFEGESLVVALAASGRLVLRRSPNAQTPRGMFCLMGVCQECVVEVDGVLTPACATEARDGMAVRTDALWRARAAAGGGR